MIQTTLTWYSPQEKMPEDFPEKYTYSYNQHTWIKGIYIYTNKGTIISVSRLRKLNDEFFSWHAKKEIKEEIKYWCFKPILE